MRQVSHDNLFVVSALQILDIFNCVERLHDADLRKAVITEKGEWVLSKIPRQNRPPGKVKHPCVTAAAAFVARHLVCVQQPTAACNVGLLWQGSKTLPSLLHHRRPTSSGWPRRCPGT